MIRDRAPWKKSLVSAALTVALCLAGCGPKEPRAQILRLGDLLPAAAKDPITLEVSGEIGEAPRRFDVRVDAARYARLTLTARGEATLVRLSWQLDGERSFPEFRSLSFPVLDGEHSYEIDLQREPYWAGSVHGLKLGTEGGALEILELKAQPAPTPYRDLALRGDSIPSLPGLERLEIPLPPEGLRDAVFEAALGVLPEYNRRGARLRFRAWLETPSGRRDVLDEELAPEKRWRGGVGWTHVRRSLSAPAGSRLILAAEATRDGKPLPAGAGAWGNPLLVLERRPQGPDVVVVVIDTLRADVLGSYGSPDGLTPNLDKLAGEAVRFSELSSTAPWTLPSVASLITGLLPPTHGAGRQRGNYAPTGLASPYATLAETLAEEDFYTRAIYHNIYLNPPFGLHQGYDRYSSVEEADDVLVDLAVKALDEYRDRRLLLYLHLFGPHNPYEPPEAECREVARRLEPGYEGELACAGDRRPQGPRPKESDWAWLEALYRAEVAFTDRQLGRLFEALKAREGERETILLVTSDHGEDFWDRQEQLVARGYEDHADHGHHFFRELMQVPGLLKLPGQPPRTSDDPVQLVDFFPTLLSALDIEPPANQGRDLLPLLSGKRLPRPALAFGPLLYGTPRRAVQKGPWKLVAPDEVEGATNALPLAAELYDARPDSPETEDLAAREPDLLEDLLQAGELQGQRCTELRQQLLARDDVLSATYLDWSHISKLRSLGYLK